MQNLYSQAFVTFLFISGVLNGSIALADQHDFESYQDKFGTIAQLANEAETPFRSSGSTIHDGPRIRQEYGDLVVTFASVKDCLLDEEANATRPDFAKMDWSKINGVKAAEVCFFRIASSYEGRAAFQRWAENLGFEFRPWYEQGASYGRSGWMATSARRAPDGREPLFWNGWIEWLFTIGSDYGTVMQLVYDSDEQIMNSSVRTFNK